MKKRIWVDCLMTLGLVVAMIPASSLPLPIHIIGGSLFYIFAVIHYRLNRKALKSLAKSQRAKFQVFVDRALLVVWILVFISDFPTMAYKIGGIEALAFAPLLHANLARLGVILVIIHLIHHRRQIRRYVKGRT